MAYVRRRGNQLVIVHGEREAGTGKVQQQILFTIYSKAEALDVLGRASPKGPNFESLLRRQFPEVTFNWKTMKATIEENLDVLPETYAYRGERLTSHFREDLAAFARQLMLADPQHLLSSAQLIQENRYELEYLQELIGWRLKLRNQKEHQFNADNPFFWRFALHGRTVPPNTEDHAAGMYERGEYKKAKAVFRLLVDSFEEYAEGYNYLGLIAYQEHDLAVAIESFAKTVELGRKLFPRKLGKRSYWVDHATRPFMRGLANLALALNEAGRFEEALVPCDRLERECGDVERASSHRADIHLNSRKWDQAAAAAAKGDDPGSSFVQALAVFELGRTDEARTLFLHAALQSPRAARMLVGVRTPTEPSIMSEAFDHNLGVALVRRVGAYLKRQSANSKAFFSSLVHHPRVSAALDEVEALSKRKHEVRPAEDRAAFERLSQLQSVEFARAEAEQLAGQVMSVAAARGKLRPRTDLH